MGFLESDSIFLSKNLQPYDNDYYKQDKYVYLRIGVIKKIDKLNRLVDIDFLDQTGGRKNIPFDQSIIGYSWGRMHIPKPGMYVVVGFREGHEPWVLSYFTNSPQKANYINPLDIGEIEDRSEHGASILIKNKRIICLNPNSSPVPYSPEVDANGNIIFLNHLGEACPNIDDIKTFAAGGVEISINSPYTHRIPIIQSNQVINPFNNTNVLDENGNPITTNTVNYTSENAQPGGPDIESFGENYLITQEVPSNILSLASEYLVGNNFFSNNLSFLNSFISAVFNFYTQNDYNLNLTQQNLNNIFNSVSNQKNNNGRILEGQYFNKNSFVGIYDNGDIFIQSKLAGEDEGSIRFIGATGKIIIEDKNKNNQIVLDPGNPKSNIEPNTTISTNGEVNIFSAKNINIHSGSKININCSGNININSSGNLRFSAENISFSCSNFNVFAKQNANLRAINVANIVGNTIGISGGASVIQEAVSIALNASQSISNTSQTISNNATETISSTAQTIDLNGTDIVDIKGAVVDIN